VERKAATKATARVASIRRATDRDGFWRAMWADPVEALTKIDIVALLLSSTAHQTIWRVSNRRTPYEDTTSSAVMRNTRLTICHRRRMEADADHQSSPQPGRFFESTLRIEC
jgi:hypothetical protein